MTGKQLKKMLVYEGLLYTVGACAVSLVIALAIKPFAGHFFESLIWFYSGSFKVWPILIMLPAFVAMGVIVPNILYKRMQRKSLVSRLAAEE